MWPGRTTGRGPAGRERRPGRTAVGRSWSHQRTGRGPRSRWSWSRCPWSGCRQPACHRSPPHPGARLDSSMCSRRAGDEPLVPMTHTSPFCRRGCPGRAPPSATSHSSTPVAQSPWVHSTAGTAPTVGVAGLADHLPDQADRLGCVPFGQLLEHLDGHRQGLGGRPDRLAAPDGRAGQDPLWPVPTQHGNQGDRLGDPPPRQRSEPVVALVSASSPGMSVPDQQERHLHDAAMSGTDGA